MDELGAKFLALLVLTAWGFGNDEICATDQILATARDRILCATMARDPILQSDLFWGSVCRCRISSGW